MTNSKPLLDPGETADLIQRLAQDLRQRLDLRAIEQPLMIGIHTGGVWLAERLHQLLELQEPLGTLDSDRRLPCASSCAPSSSSWV